MIPIANVPVTGSIVNPDKSAIQKKSLINIPISTFDISASNHTTDIKLNNTNNLEIILLDDQTADEFDTYYTPLYTEKINYNVWKTTINKTFQELEIS